MKNSLFSILICFVAISARSQSTVPTSWNCEGSTPPTGWTFVQTNAGNTNYVGNSSCDQVSSLRLDFDAEALIINFGEQPGPFTYKIGGTAGGGPTQWNGVFTVDESVNGTNWVNIKTYNSTDLSITSCANESFNFSNPASRYLRFYYQDKQTGCNLILDEISVVEPVITTASISVDQQPNSIAILDGGIAQPFTGNSFTISVNNEGTLETLTVSSINISSTDAGAYSITSPAIPFDVTPGGSVDVVIAFAPAAQGTTMGEVTIASNDADDPNFIFHLYGVNGTLATQPTGEITTGTAPLLKSYRLVYNFAGTVLNQDSLGGYVVLRSDQAITEGPADGTVYQRGQSIGAAKVVLAGRPADDQVSILTNYVQAAKTYHFAVFSYAGSGSVTNYTSQINDVHFTTPTTMVSGTEYTGISTAATTFVSDLHALIRPHTAIFYGNYASTMMNLFVVRDTFVTGGVTFTKVINCSYSGETKLFNPPFDWTATGYSREHTYAHSWMPTFDASNPELPEYNDQHNLYPTKQANVNELRCNYPFGEVVTVESGWPATNPQGVLGLDALGNRVYEPREEQKGRVARALMYMAVSYTEGANVFGFNNVNGKSCLSFQIDYPQDQNIMKKWHFEHPPTGWDIARNDFLDSLQGNRNPFVDQPDYACFINFTNLSKVSTPGTPCWEDNIGFEKINNMNFNVFPNPTPGNVRLSWAGIEDKLKLEVYDISGKLIDTHAVRGLNGVNVKEIQFDLPAGMYTIHLIGSKSSATQRLVITN